WPRNMSGSPRTRKGRGRGELHLEDPRPVLPRDPEASAVRIVGDAVRDLSTSNTVPPGKISVDVHPSEDFASRRIDAGDVVLLPHVRPDLAPYPLELVEREDRAAVVA